MKLVTGRDDLAAAAEKAAAAAGAPLERLAVKPVHKASRGFLNGGSPEVCELAIVTLLQAVAYRKPVVLLPITTLTRFQHQTLVTCGELTVGDIEGRSVGIRSWSQTTGVWMRGFLSQQYGVDLRKVNWIVYEGGHVDEYTDPEWVSRAPAGEKLQQDFLDGRLDFGIMGNELPKDDRIRTVVPDALDVAAQWAADKGFAPVNHVMGVSVAAARVNSASICAIYDGMRDAVEESSASGAAQRDSAGFEALRGPISAAADFAFEQQVLPRRVDFDELVSQSCDALGVSPARLGG
ncbi:hypothetical protein [Nocardia macrotermitis]|uniref:4,5-dihydroxyphthalate decarboxylase n=1 Tax=Nocardia macrotermitis TaxID=2585198 RepID=A0A7K0D1U5_9NOCA|nr:hypothetical protein [Nocardia macrotermitis]MQY19679.1 hypothetical protein [Nocardia macrotermitis]